MRVLKKSAKSEGLCRNYDPEMWSRWGKKWTVENTEAKRICARCPIRRDCLDDALENPGMAKGMIWGGIEF